MLKIIKTADRAPYRPKYYPFMEKHFANPDFAYAPSDFSAWRGSEFLIVSIGLDDEEVKSYGSMLIATRDSAEKLAAGQIQENQVEPYRGGDSTPASLFWLTLILENRQHAAYLVRSLFKEVEERCRKWKINIDTVFVIAYTKVSERLMRRYGFEKTGEYQGRYPIMSAKVTDNIYLKAMIPHIRTETHTPWGK